MSTNLTPQGKTELSELVGKALKESRPHLRLTEKIWLLEFVFTAAYLPFTVETQTKLSRISRKFPELLGVQIRAIIERDDE